MSVTEINDWYDEVLVQSSIDQKIIMPDKTNKKKQLLTAKKCTRQQINSLITQTVIGNLSNLLVVLKLQQWSSI